MSDWIQWLSDHLATCPIKALTGLECPGCGFQRAGIALLRGELVNSLRLYPAFIPLVMTWLLLLLHLVFKFRQGAKWVKYAFIVSASIVFVNFVVKATILYQQH